MAGRPRKKTPDTKKSTEELVKLAAKLFQTPYDDQKGRRKSYLPSIRSVAEEMNTSILRVRKLLITAEFYTTEQSREVQRRFAEGQTIEQIMGEMCIKKASVYSYLPYQSIAYNLNETTVNADRHRLFRRRKKAVEELGKRIGHPDGKHYLWEALILFVDYPFQTAKGLKYSYTIKNGRDGEYVEEIVFDRKVKSVTRATINMAYEKALEIQEKEGYVSGPKKLGVLGASYLYPVFVRLGVITPEKEAE